jgi:hypothetical protein
MGDTAITDVDEDKGIKEVEVFDDDDKEEEKRQYFQELDYDSVVISEKIKNIKKLLKEKFNKLNKQSALLYSYESCKKIFDRIDKEGNSDGYGIMQSKEVSEYLINLLGKETLELDYIDLIFFERFEITRNDLSIAKKVYREKERILGNIRSEFTQLESHVDDSLKKGTGIKGANLFQFIEFMNKNKDKKKHSKEILLLTETIDIAKEKIKYEIVDCRLKGLKGTISILKANSLILDFFKNILDKLQQCKSSEEIEKIILDFDNLFFKEIMSLSKSKIYLEYQHVRFDSDTMVTLYNEDKDVLLEILVKQAQELLNEIFYLKNFKYNDDIVKKLLQIPILATTLAVQAQAIKNEDIVILAIKINTLSMNLLRYVDKISELVFVDTLNSLEKKAKDIIVLVKSFKSSDHKAAGTVAIQDAETALQKAREAAAVETAAVETAAVETAAKRAKRAKTAVETESVETESVETAVETESVETKSVETAVETAAAETAAETAADDMQEKIIEIDDHNLKKLEKILGILQDFIRTECIDDIKTSFADSMITLKLSSIIKKFEIEVQIHKLIEDTKLKRIAYNADMFSKEETPLHLQKEEEARNDPNELTLLVVERRVDNVYNELLQARDQVNHVITIITSQNKTLMEDEETSLAITQIYAADAAYAAQQAMTKAVNVLTYTENTIKQLNELHFPQEFQEKLKSQNALLYIVTRQLTIHALKQAQKALEKTKNENQMEEDKFTSLIKTLLDIENTMELEDKTKEEQKDETVNIIIQIDAVKAANTELEIVRDILLKEAKKLKLKNQEDVIKILEDAKSYANYAIQMQTQYVEFSEEKALEKLYLAINALERLYEARYAVIKVELTTENDKLRLLEEPTRIQAILANTAINKAIETLANIMQQIQQIEGEESNVEEISKTLITLNDALDNAEKALNALRNANILLNQIVVAQNKTRSVVENAQYALTEELNGLNILQNQPVYTADDRITRTNSSLMKSLMVLQQVNDELNKTPLITLTQKIYLLRTILNLEIVALYQAELNTQVMMKFISDNKDKYESVDEKLGALHTQLLTIQNKLPELLQLNINDEHFQLRMQYNRDELVKVFSMKNTALELLERYRITTEQLGGKKQKKKKSKKGEIITFKF